MGSLFFVSFASLLSTTAKPEAHCKGNHFSRNLQIVLTFLRIKIFLLISFNSFAGINFSLYLCSGITAQLWFCRHDSHWRSA